MRASTQTFYEDAVRGAVRAIVADLDQALELDALARAAACSMFHFHRIFKGMVGETPLQLHRRLRLERAAHELMHGERPVTAIAFAAGYDSHEGFTRAFQGRYGHAPSSWRELARERHFHSTRLPTRTGIHYEVGGPSADKLTLITPGGPIMNVDIVTTDALRVATLRHTGPYHLIGDTFTALHGKVAPLDLYARPGTFTVAIYHDDQDQTPSSELRSDAGIIVPDDLELPDGLTEVTTTGGRYARWTHTGSYASLGDAWARFMGEWLPASGERMREGTCYELYRNSPAHTPEDELVTELYVAIA